MNRSEITEDTKQKIQTMIDLANTRTWRDVEVDYAANWVVIRLVDNIETINIAAVNVHECETQDDLTTQLMVELIETAEGLTDRE